LSPYTIGYIYMYVQVFTKIKYETRTTRYLQLRGHYLTTGTVEFWEHFLSPFSLVEK